MSVFPEPPGRELTGRHVAEQQRPIHLAECRTIDLHLRQQVRVVRGHLGKLQLLEVSEHPQVRHALPLEGRRRRLQMGVGQDGATVAGTDLGAMRVQHIQHIQHIQHGVDDACGEHRPPWGPKTIGMLRVAQGEVQCIDGGASVTARDRATRASASLASARWTVTGVRGPNSS